MGIFKDWMSRRVNEAQFPQVAQTGPNAGATVLANANEPGFGGRVTQMKLQQLLPLLSPMQRIKVKQQMDAGMPIDQVYQFASDLRMGAAQDRANQSQPQSPPPPAPPRRPV